MKRNLTTALLVLGLIAFAYMGIANITKTNHKLKTQDIKLQSKQSDLQLLEIKFNKLNVDLEKERGNKTQDQQKIDDLQKQKDELQKQLQDTEAQLQAKAKQREADASKVAQAASLSVTAHAESGNFYKDYIYSHESSNSTTAVNSIGCRGLGQACPGTKLPCGDDYACQDAYFTQYAMDRYGSWESAYLFWSANHWW